MPKEPRRYSQFSLRWFFAVMTIAGIASFLISLIPGPPPSESDLANSDTVVLSTLRAKGLNIKSQHMCGMGELAVFEIERCDDRLIHITQVFIKHRNPFPFIDDIQSLPELESLIIGDVYSSKFVTIKDRSKFNRETIIGIMAASDEMNKNPQ